MNSRKLLIAGVIIGFLNFITTTLPAQTPTNINLIQDSVYMFTDSAAQFPGGIDNIYTQIKQNLQYPDSSLLKNIQGKVVVRFIVRKNGQTDGFSILKGVNHEIDQEAIRVVKKLQGWEPAKKSNHFVSSYFILPINFKISKEKTLSSNYNFNSKDAKDSIKLISSIYNINNVDTSSITVSLRLIPIVIDSIQMPNDFNANLINLNYIDKGKFVKPYPITLRDSLMSKYGSFAQWGVILLKTKKTDVFSIPQNSSKKVNYEGKEILNVSDSIPVFAGGRKGLEKYLNSNVTYPATADELNLHENNTIHFIVDTLGTAKDFTFDHTGLKVFDFEMLKDIKSIKNWIPYCRNGKKSEVLVSIPYAFIKKNYHRDIIKFFEDSYSKNVTYNPQIRINGKFMPLNFDVSLLNPAALTKDQNSSTRNVQNFFSHIYSSTIRTIQYNDVRDSTFDTDTKSQGPEKMPEFPGGKNALFRFLADNIHYPVQSQENGEHGRVITQFIVTKTGRIKDIVIVRSVTPLLDSEAIRVIMAMPKWIPGMQHGKPIAVRYTLPINFQIH